MNDFTGINTFVIVFIIDHLIVLILCVREYNQLEMF